MIKIKSFLIIVISTLNLFYIPVFARRINSDEAILVANKRLERLNKTTDFFIVKCNEIVIDDLFAFSIDLYPKGYVVVTANTNLPPIIAYSFESNFGEFNSDNLLYSIIVNDLKKQSIYVSKSKSQYSIKNNDEWADLLNNTTKEIKTLIQWPDVGNGWIKTNWTQNSPYNDFCPMDPVTNQRSIAGCPSVAMGQILNFHASTNNTYFDDLDDYYHNYSGRQYWIDNDYTARDFPSFPQLNVYLDTLNIHYLNNILPTNQDKAALTFACGVAAYQVYTSASSGTFGVN